MTSSGLKTLVMLLAGAGLIVGGSVWGYGPEDAPTATTTAASSSTDAGFASVTVWKSPACACCAAWVDHLREAGFTVDVRETEDMVAVKREHQVATHLQSCHTAVIDGYVIEGHVPAPDIVRLLEDQPQVAGLAVPGMPVGSPGMEMGDRRDRYDVVTFDQAGRTTVWASYP